MTPRRCGSSGCGRILGPLLANGPEVRAPRVHSCPGLPGPPGAAAGSAPSSLVRAAPRPGSRVPGAER
ncbi:hypothetical protein NDU88_008250 [Pleurodeles waltl]|uniref:Uncharacterized protein n=1 Tax=Pleurodeles waltl TaxID=8319 RepID=A0AAV7U5Z5_PLEWA|nr:hypothetical protein NDU88_008250 [Pleurodeles waltl]